MAAASLQTTCRSTGIRLWRRLSALALGLSLAAVIVPSRAEAAVNPVVAENARAGTTEWKLVQPANDRDHQIKGYASTTSVNKGGSIGFSVSVNRAQTFRIDFYRIGWYQGTGGRFMGGSGTLNGRVRPLVVADPLTGMIDENWPVSYTLRVPFSWTSGIYMAKLTNFDGYQNYVPFVVRDDSRWSALLYQQSVTTDQAYNNFPDVFNPPTADLQGKSMYEGSSSGPATVAGTTRAVKVSFNRPYADDGSGKFFLWEAQQVRFQERMGYDVTYVTDIDTALNGWILLRHKGFISAGHDEYWTSSMRDAVERARDAGVNLAFFGSNAAYWRIRLEASRNGTANRVMVCYKDAAIDPVTSAAGKTILFRQLGRPEQTLIGIQYITYGSSLAGNSSWLPQNTGDPLFRGTGFGPGSSVSGLVGYEIDSYDPSYPKPAAVPNTWTLLATSPYDDANGLIQNANTVSYQAPSGAWVFGSGTLSWSWGLDDNEFRVADAGIQQMTKNVMDRMSGVVLSASDRIRPADSAVASAVSDIAPDTAGLAARAYRPPTPEVGPPAAE